MSRAVEFDYIDGERIRTDSITDNNTGISKIVLENINFYTFEFVHPKRRMKEHDFIYLSKKYRLYLAFKK